MIKVKRTIVLDGQNKTEYEMIISHLIETNSEQQGWTLQKEPLINRVTAIKTEELEKI